jgi:hypothetical protein
MRGSAESRRLELCQIGISPVSARLRLPAPGWFQIPGAGARAS